MTAIMRGADSPLVQRIAAEIRAELARQGISQEALAQRIGRDQTWVSRRTTGAIPIDVAELEAIAAVLSVPVHQLIPAPDPTPGGSR
jgi:transcriptional regulator with XRE-family HTH domain